VACYPARQACKANLMANDAARLRAVDEALDEAIREALEVRGFNVGVVVDRFVCVALQHFDDDGTSVSSIARVVPGEEIPHYRMLGMLDVLATRLRRDYMTDGEND
jgi:hypothetical protein